MVKITREQLFDIYEKHGIEPIIDAFLALQDTVEKLERRVEQLEQQVAKNSHNSSKPPSSDMFRTPRSLGEKSGKPRGGQPGHEGRSLRQVEKPAHIKDHFLKGTCECGRDLSKGKRRGYERRQVFDIPKPSMEVTEHRAETKECSCGRLHTAAFPAGIDAPVQYGSNIRSMLVYFSQYQLIPQKRISEAMGDLFNAPVSQATVNKAIQEAYVRLEATEEAIKERIQKSAVAHGDETGMYIGGDRWWQHGFGTTLFTYFFCHRKRGKLALRDDGIVKQFVGRLVHDGWLSYFDIDCMHALCNAHHLRELIFLREECHQRWAGTMIKHLCHIKKVVDRAKVAGRKQLPPKTLLHYRQRYESIVARGNRANPRQINRKVAGSRGRIKQTAARNLLNRLEKYTDETLAFMYDFEIPFDNNLAERDLRMSKVKQKVSGCFRSVFGAQAFCRIRGYISTVRKHDLNVFDQIFKCFDPTVNQLILVPVERE
jgi:transposase